MTIPTYAWFLIAAVGVASVAAFVRSSRTHRVVGDHPEPLVDETVNGGMNTGRPGVTAPTGKIIEASLGVGQGTLAFALVQGVGIIGPCDSRPHATKFLRAPLNVQKKNVLTADTSSEFPVCIIRHDLSSPPFLVWEFTFGNGQPRFAVRGPAGWLLPATADHTAARALALSQKKLLEADNMGRTMNLGPN